MLHDKGLGPVVGGLAVPIEGTIGEIVLVRDALGDLFVDEPHDRCDLNCGSLKTSLLPARLFQRLHMVLSAC